MNKSMIGFVLATSLACHSSPSLAAQPTKGTSTGESVASTDYSQPQVQTIIDSCNHVRSQKWSAFEQAKNEAQKATLAFHDQVRKLLAQFSPTWVARNNSDGENRDYWSFDKILENSDVYLKDPQDHRFPTGYVVEYDLEYKMQSGKQLMSRFSDDQILGGMLRYALWEEMDSRQRKALGQKYWDQTDAITEAKNKKARDAEYPAALEKLKNILTDGEAGADYRKAKADLAAAFEKADLTAKIYSDEDKENDRLTRGNVVEETENLRSALSNRKTELEYQREEFEAYKRAIEASERTIATTSEELDGKLKNPEMKKCVNDMISSHPELAPQGVSVKQLTVKAGPTAAAAAAAKTPGSPVLPATP